MRDRYNGSSDHESISQNLLPLTDLALFLVIAMLFLSPAKYISSIDLRAGIPAKSTVSCNYSLVAFLEPNGEVTVKCFKSQFGLETQFNISDTDRAFTVLRAITTEYPTEGFPLYIDRNVKIKDTVALLNVMSRLGLKGSINLDLDYGDEFK